MKEFINLQAHSRQRYINDFINDYEEKTEETIKEFLETCLESRFVLKDYKDIKDLAKQVISKNLFYISYQLHYQNDSFATMSAGKKAFVVLKLLLDFSAKKCPILIDQPEDSLDNRDIYNELVGYIKTKKKDRQIILVTHNANVVVNADSEQVIVANQHGDNAQNRDAIKFQYVTGSLENTKIKDLKEKIILFSQGINEHVCEVLEGGESAFEQRKKKYGI
jgi:predicted ATP-dependent endonuclease of OLD family